jgi:hypothetical protein
MRRLLRLAFNLCAMVSALLCVGVCALWAGTKDTAGYGWVRTRSGVSASCISEGGAVQFKVVSRDYPRWEARWVRPRELEDTWDLIDLGGSPLLGMGGGSGTLFLRPFTGGRGRSYAPGLLPSNVERPSFPFWYVILPHGLIAVCAAVLPAAWVYTRVRRTRRPGLCPSCGYDLRATPEV